jgi:hypothetical protein
MMCEAKAKRSNVAQQLILTDTNTSQSNTSWCP